MGKGILDSEWRGCVVLLCLLATAALSGCVSQSTKDRSAEQGNAREASYTSAMQNGEKALTDNHADKALSSFLSASKLYPDRKEPWQRIAQVQFEHGNYVEAAVAAQEVIQRTGEGNDSVAARSILAVSGLRMSVRALAELRGGDFLRGDVRREAETLAEKLRTTLNQQVLVPQSLVAEENAADQSAARAPKTVSQSKTRKSGAASSVKKPAPDATASGGAAAADDKRPAAVQGPAAVSGDPFGALK